jgi:hypothetical protein
MVSVTLDYRSSSFKLQIETRPEQTVVLDNAKNIRQERFQKPFQVFEKLVGARGFIADIPVCHLSGHTAPQDRRYASFNNRSQRIL